MSLSPLLSFSIMPHHRIWTRRHSRSDKKLKESRSWLHWTMNLFLPHGDLMGSEAEDQRENLDSDYPPTALRLS